MNLHEYQGKEILASFGVGIQRGIVAQTADEAVAEVAQRERELVEQADTEFRFHSGPIV